MTPAGEGILDLASIISLAHKTGVRHFYVEQDMMENPVVALEKSLDYLKTIEL